MSAAAERAVDQNHARTGSEPGKHLLGQNGNVNGRGWVS
jgi:hypothetical protein